MLNIITRNNLQLPASFDRITPVMTFAPTALPSHVTLPN